VFSVNVDIRAVYVSWPVNRTGLNIHIHLSNWIDTNKTIESLSCCIVKNLGLARAERNITLVIWLLLATDAGGGSTLSAVRMYSTIFNKVEPLPINVDLIIHGLVLHCSSTGDGVLVYRRYSDMVHSKNDHHSALALKTWYEPSVSSAVSFLQ
jgi:hypothetical protein